MVTFQSATELNSQFKASPRTVPVYIFWGIFSYASNWTSLVA